LPNNCPECLLASIANRTDLDEVRVWLGESHQDLLLVGGLMRVDDTLVDAGNAAIIRRRVIAGDVIIGVIVEQLMRLFVPCKSSDRKRL
jgi:hypothetical protein